MKSAALGSRYRASVSIRIGIAALSGDAVTWQGLTGRRVRVDGELARVVHVNSFRIILMTESGDGVSPHRVVLPQDDPVDVEELDERHESPEPNRQPSGEHS